LQRDTDTKVGQILATTPMRKSFYTVAKMISNFAVLAAMVGVLMVVGVVMQLVRAEDPHLSLWKLWSPFLFVALPAMAITAAMAILFETLPVLRGGVGNVIYFFVWTAGLAAGINHIDDFAGFHVFVESMRTALNKVAPGMNNHEFNFNIGSQKAARVFLWEGIEWTPRILLMRLGWVCLAFGTALLASLFFHRFDPGREWRKLKRSAPPPKKNGVVDVVAFNPNAQVAHLTPIVQRAGSNRFAHLVMSELRLLLKGHAWWWYVVAGGLFIATLTAPLDGARGVLLAAWLWPVLVWSQMGAREARFRTDALIFSSEKALYRQLPAVWMAGVIVAVIAGGGLGIRLLLGGDWAGLLAWTVGACFIPSLALALGVWSGTSKSFEAIYTIWWYMGPAHYMQGMDFMGLSAASRSTTLYLVFATGLLLAAYVGRRQRIAYA